MSDKHNPGVYGGSRVGFLEHEVDNWIRRRPRVSTGLPVAEPVPPPLHLTIIPPKEAARRTGFTRVHLWRLEKMGRFPSRVRLIDAEVPDDEE
jgi:predicted DNA-binding transcriptional regulator AlpA